MGAEPTTGDKREGLEITRCKGETCVEQSYDFLMSRNTPHMDLLPSREESQDCIVENIAVSVKKNMDGNQTAHQILTFCMLK